MGISLISVLFSLCKIEVNNSISPVGLPEDKIIYIDKVFGKKITQYVQISFSCYSYILEISLMAQMVKNLPAMQETWVSSLGQEDPLEKRMATHSTILACGIPWTEKSGGLQSMVS